jgi:hypothetical protein
MKTHLEELKSIDLSKVHNDDLKEQVKKSITHTEGKDSVHETQIKNNEKVIELVKKAFPAAIYGETPKSPAAKKKIEKVMHEFKTGKLKSSSGEIVTDHHQAMAIALSEARKIGEGSGHSKTKSSKKKDAPAKKKKEKHVYKIAGKDISTLSCEELYAAVRESHKKRTATGKKSKPVIEKVALGVHHAVKAAVKNISTKDLENHPTETINKIEKLKKSASEFLNDFKGLLGADYDKSEVKQEVEALEQLIEKLKEKYITKK